MGARFRGVSLPPVLAYVHGDLAADIPLTAATPANVFITASLAVGMWLLHFEVEAANGGAVAGSFTIAMDYGTATITFLGSPVAEQGLPASLGALASTSLDALIQVTAAGTVKLIAESTVAATIKSTSVYFGGVPTNYTGLKIG